MLTSDDLKVAAFNEVRAAKIEHDIKKAEVIAWMDAEAKQYHLRRNGDAPAWRAYENALRHLDETRDTWGL